MANTDTLQMKEAIIASIDNPTELERIYRNNKTGFTQAFESVYPDIRENAVAQVWHERLYYKQDEISWGKKNELLFVVVTALTAGLLARYRKYYQLMRSVFIPATSHSWFFLF